MRALLHKMDLNPELSIAGVIVAVWVATVIVSVFARGRDVPPTVNALMMAAAGWVFSRGYIGKREQKNGD